MLSTLALPKKVVVVGAGTMGVRIALSFAMAGADVCATSRREASLRGAEEILVAELASVEPGRRPRVLIKGRPRAAAPVHGPGRIDLRTSAENLLGLADLVIETVREDLSEKLSVLEHIQQFARPESIVTTNTSSLDLSDLVHAISPSGRFAGLHWFHPADLVELVEVVPAPGTEESTLKTLGCWLTRIGKAPVILNKAIPGFVANRLQYALLREAYSLVTSGVCTYADVDQAVTAGLGPRWAALGPFECMDFAGLDVHLAVVRELFPDLACDRSAPTELTGLIADGHLGAKSGVGLRGDYSPERRQALTRLRDETLRRVASLRTALSPDSNQQVEERLE
jgi:3-hydroxyacyl-CoA dehydrogenase